MSTARLGFAVDSSQVKSAAVDLDRLTTSAGHVEQKTARLRDEFGRFVSAGHAAGRATEQVEQANDNAANAVTRHAMAIAKLTAAEARMGATHYASRAEDIAAFGAELDRLRAKYNPVFAASKAYDGELNDLNRAHAIGAINAQEKAAALDMLNARYQLAAAGANVAATATLQMAKASRIAMHNNRQLSFQLIDIGQALATAPTMGIYALQNLGFQVAQIGQLYMGRGGFNQAIKDSAVQVASFVRWMGPLAAVAGMAGAALAGMTHEINQVSDVTVGMGDVALATFQVIRDGIFETIRPAVEAMAPWFGAAWDWVADKTIWLGNLIINSFHAAFVDVNAVVDSIAAVFAGGYEAVVAVWSGLPAALGDFVYSTANRVVQGVEDMINGAITRLNKLIAMLPDWVDISGFDQIEFGGIENPYAGAASALGGQLAEIGGRTSSALGDIWANRNAAVSDIMGSDPLGGFFDAVSVRAVQNALEGVKDEAGAAGKALKGAADDAKDPWNGLTEEMERMQNALQDAGRETGGILKGLIDGTLSWKDALSQALSVAMKLMMQFNPGLFGGGFVQGLLGFSHGGVITQGNVVPFANGGVVNRPTVFPMANGAGLMGEAGPEAIMPLRRGPDGRLGVSAPRQAANDQPMRLELVSRFDADGGFDTAVERASRPVAREESAASSARVSRSFDARIDGRDEERRVRRIRPRSPF
ncbi:hypothetical protein [Nitratireductor sp. GZWM139]|uniref:phage tail tape measure protein n=1 Tax=Nitratireductor sp. GZWM139 TaxID=2950541 RepID=UPI0032DFD5F5